MCSCCLLELVDRASPSLQQTPSSSTTVTGTLRYIRCTNDQYNVCKYVMTASFLPLAAVTRVALCLCCPLQLVDRASLLSTWPSGQGVSLIAADTVIIYDSD